LGLVWSVEMGDWSEGAGDVTIGDANIGIEGMGNLERSEANRKYE
jgi:hypothetical protein